MKIFPNDWSDNFPLFLTVGRQLFLPGLLAIGYGLYDCLAQEKELTVLNLTKSAAPALFLIMWLIGIFLRAKKRAGDDLAFREISNEIHSLRDLIDQTIAGNPGIPPARTRETTRDIALMVGAFDLADSGNPLAALLQAGVAFERALRRFAHLRGIPAAETIPLHKVIQESEGLVPDGWQDELHRLRMIRNKIAHASDDELEDLGNVEAILDTYATAIQLLEQRHAPF